MLPVDMTDGQRRLVRELLEQALLGRVKALSAGEGAQARGLLQRLGYASPAEKLNEERGRG